VSTGGKFTGGVVDTGGKCSNDHVIYDRYRFHSAAAIMPLVSTTLANVFTGGGQLAFHLDLRISP
jgi:hypothetical protein